MWRRPLAFGLPLLLTGSAVAEEAEGRRIALVIGVSSYPQLPPELSLDTPRAEAARIAAALEQGAGFDEVRLLTDASASTANVLEVLRQEVSKDVQWRDLFLLYFVGHGLGADFGEPRLLFYDTDPDNLEGTSLPIRELADVLQKHVPASRYVVVTDAAFNGTLNGVALLGPTGNDWPLLGSQSFAMSSAAPHQVATPGVFSRAFVAGAVDRAALPAVDKAKFVFQSGEHPEVLCTGMTVAQPCDPSCYLWEVPVGPCEVRVSSGGEPITGSVNLLYRGAYTCGLYQGALQCSLPPPPL
jgi:hypothetical protein